MKGAPGRAPAGATSLMLKPSTLETEGGRQPADPAGRAGHLQHRVVALADDLPHGPFAAVALGGGEGAKRRVNAGRALEAHHESTLVQSTVDPSGGNGFPGVGPSRLRVVPRLSPLRAECLEDGYAAVAPHETLVLLGLDGTQGHPALAVEEQAPAVLLREG